MSMKMYCTVIPAGNKAYCVGDIKTDFVCLALYLTPVFIKNDDGLKDDPLEWIWPDHSGLPAWNNSKDDYAALASNEKKLSITMEIDGNPFEVEYLDLWWWKADK